uniref:Uncharacterized protein n=1 Tax=Lepeophtheirus salmonis TaxID=72036 RepID=A0A0K2TP17_LEPSM
MLNSNGRPRIFMLRKRPSSFNTDQNYVTQDQYRKSHWVHIRV